MSQQIRHRKPILLLTLALLAIVTVVHLSLLDSSPFLDEGDHVNTGRLLSHGKLMYKDAFNEKGPGLYWLTAILFKLFGEHFRVVRHAATFFALLTMILLVLSGFRYQSAWGGLSAATVFALFHIFLLGRLWTPEIVLAPLALGVLLLLRTERENQTPKSAESILAGLLLFFGTYIKQTMWVLVVVLAILMLLTALRRRDKPFFKSLILLMAGLGVPWMAVVVREFSRGMLPVFLDGYFFPLFTFELRPAFEMPSQAEFFIELPIWWMVMVTLYGVRRVGFSKWNRNLLFSLFLFQLLVMPPAFFAQHFLPMLAFSGLGFALVLSRGGGQRRGLTIAALGVFCLLLLLGALHTPRQYRDRIGQFRMQDWVNIADHVAQITAPDEPIFVFPHDSTYYFLARRDSPGPHAFLLPWTTPPVVLEKVIRDFEKRPPQAILYTYLANCTPTRIFPHSYLGDLLQWIAARYRIERIFANRVILLTPGASPPDTKEQCRTRQLLFSDLSCFHQPPEDIEKFLADFCDG